MQKNSPSLSLLPTLFVVRSVVSAYNRERIYFVCERESRALLTRPTIIEDRIITRYLFISFFFTLQIFISNFIFSFLDENLIRGISYFHNFLICDTKSPGNWLSK